MANGGSPIETKRAPNPINWFPGHMAKALRQVKEKVKKVDLVVDIRDARAPLATGNPALQKVMGGKPSLVILNKSDLADKEAIQLWKKWFTDSGQFMECVSALQPSTIKRIPATARKLMKEKWKSFEKKGIRPPPLRMMIIGIPNTGKSTIINRLTRRSVTRTGDRPGVTRSQEWIVVGKDIECLDTPGIMPPKIETEEQGYWLCAIHAIKDEILGKERVARFVVESLLDKNKRLFKERYSLENTDQAIEKILLDIGERLNFRKRKGEIDIAKTSGQILQDFRQGLLGSISFEMPPD